MHGICTGLVGICITFVRKKRKLRYCGLFATFTLAMVYHSIFNALVQSDKLVVNYIGFALLIAAYTYIVILYRRYKNKLKQQNKHPAE